MTMTRYFVKALSAPECEWSLLANNLDDAIAEVRWEYANTGKRVLIERKYTLVEANEQVIDTDY